MLLTAINVVAIGVGVLAFLIVVGLGVTELMLPSTGFGLLLAPAVGLGILSLGFQWLVFFVPPYVAAIAVFVGGGALTGFVLWRRKPNLIANPPDLASVAVVGLVFYVALLLMVIRRRFLTLGGFPSDNVFIYTQAAQYLRDHVAPTATHAAYVNPGASYLVGTGLAFPNSVGSIDAATSVLSGLPVYALFDPLTALALAMTVGPVWFIARACLGAGWSTALAAAALLATNQLLFWVIGNGFQQESLALPIFTTALGIVAVAVRSGSVKAGALAGILGAALMGLYLPIAILLGLCAIACAVVRITVPPRPKLESVWRPVAAAAGAGAVGSIASLWVLLHGGIAGWQAAVGTRVPAGGVSSFPPFPYLVGTLPYAHRWGGVTYGHIEQLAVPLLLLASGVLLVLLVAGFLWAALHEHASEAAILGAGSLFVLYEFAVAQYPYGFVKAIGYMVPLSSVFIAFGAVDLESRLRRFLAARARLVAAAVIAIVLVASANASRDMIGFFVDRPPSFPYSYLAFDKFASVIPEGSSVFVDQVAPDYATLVRLAAVTYFLPDRNVRVFAGSLRGVTFLEQNIRPESCAFDYIIAPVAPQGGFTLVYWDPVEKLGVYKNVGTRCSGA